MISVREKPPLRQHITAITPSGRHYRWGEDEPSPENVFRDLRNSSTMPGGHENMDCVLPRKPGVDYSDLERLTTLRIIGAGGEVDGEYRLERAPRVSGDEMAISPSAVGWQAHLEDDKSARMNYIDRDVGRWSETVPERRIERANAGFSQGKIPVSIGNGGVVWDLPSEAIASGEHSEIAYDPGSGLTVAALLYAGTRVGASWASFEAAGLRVDDSVLHGSDQIVALTLDGAPREETVPTPERHLILRVRATGAITPAAGHQQSYTSLGVIGNHGLSRRSGSPSGYWASDIVSHAVQTWAPILQLKADSIQQSSFVIPHLVFLDPTTAGEIVRQVSRFNLPDWAVWDDREFVWHERGTRGRRWRARIGPSQLEETGPQLDRLWESIVVSYQDVDGGTRTVGPPGSGADTISNDLKDDDPENPANKLGIVRRDLLQMGVSTAAGATEVGRRFLEQTKLLDHSGRATFVGWVEDDRGVTHPYSRVRAGDSVVFVDAADKSERRIVRADHSRSSRSCTVDLDAPPEGLQALLERLGVVLQPLGL